MGAEVRMIRIDGLGDTWTKVEDDATARLWLLHVIQHCNFLAARETVLRESYARPARRR